MNRNSFQTIGILLLLHVCVAYQAESAPRLTFLGRTNSQANILLEGETKGSYVLFSSTNLNDWTPCSTNTSLESKRLVKFDATNAFSYYRTMRLPMSIFSFAVATREQIEINGYVLRADSYDSGNPLWSLNGQYFPWKRHDQGDIACSNTNSLMLGNCDIFGRVFVPPGGSVGVNMGTIGDLLLNREFWSGIEPGYVLANLVMEFEDIHPPFQGGVTPSSGTNDGVYYDYLLGNGNYLIDRLNMSDSQRLFVKSNATLFVTGDINISSNASIIVSTGACLRLFVAGTNATLNGNLINYAGNVTNFAYFGLPSNASLSLGGIPVFSGVVYAPNADLTIDGARRPYLAFLGSFVVKSLRLNANVYFDYDEALQRGPYFR